MLITLGTTLLLALMSENEKDAAAQESRALMMAMGMSDLRIPESADRRQVRLILAYVLSWEPDATSSLGESDSLSHSDFLEVLTQYPEDPMEEFVPFSLQIIGNARIPDAVFLNSEEEDISGSEVVFVELLVDMPQQAPGGDSTAEWLYREPGFQYLMDFFPSWIVDILDMKGNSIFEDRKTPTEIESLHLLGMLDDTTILQISWDKLTEQVGWGSRMPQLPRGTVHLRSTDIPRWQT